MVLKKLYRKSTGRFEYALVSKINPKKILFYFGTKKPGKSEFLRQERRITYFKNLKGRKTFGSFSKRKVWVRRRDQVKQRYWVGKKPRKNFGSKMFREQIKKELYRDNELRNAHFTILTESLKKDPFLYDAQIITDPRFGSKQVIKVIEKNPDLLKNLKNTSVFFYESDRLAPSGFSHRQRNILAIDKRVLADPPVWIDPISKSKREHSLKDIIRHEVTHFKQRHLSPDEQKELAANLAMRMDIRKEKPSKKAIDEDISKYFAN